MMVDHQALTDVVDNFDHLTTEQKARARRTCAAYATDADELVDLMAMLGISPAQERERCAEVSTPILPGEQRRTA